MGNSGLKSGSGKGTPKGKEHREVLVRKSACGFAAASEKGRGGGRQGGGKI